MFTGLTAPLHRLNLETMDSIRLNHVGMACLFTMALMGLALFARLAIAPVSAGLQYVTFFPAVTLAAIVGGYRSGLLATIIGLFFATYIFTPPYYSFSIMVWQISLWANLVFLMDGIIISFSIEAMHRYRQNYQKELEQTRGANALVVSLNKRLGEHINEHNRLDAYLKKSESAQRKRVKELSCLYAVSHDMQEGLSIDEICRRAIEHLISAMQFPEITVPVLDVKGKRYTTEKYTEGLSHSLHAEFRTGAETFGHLFVYYAEPQSFLIPEEQDLVNVVALDISVWLERVRVENALLEQEKFFRMIAENVEDFIAVLDLQGRRLYNSPSYARLFGDTEALKGTDSFIEIHPDDRERIKKVFKETVLSGAGQCAEYRMILQNGEIRYIESCGGLINNSQGEPLHVVVVSRDITGRKQAEEEIHQLAFYDTLTKLPNRCLLKDRLAQTMAACKRSGRYSALMFLDLNNFKPLNDQYGHDAGDMVLVEAARRMSACVREVDTVARFGGDEFIIVLSELHTDKAESTAEAGSVAEKIRALLAEPFVLKIRQKGNMETIVRHYCTSSIGAVLFIDHAAGAEDVIKCADKAMYLAKQAGRNQVRFYDTNAA